MNPIRHTARLICGSGGAPRRQLAAAPRSVTARAPFSTSRPRPFWLRVDLSAHLHQPPAMPCPRLHTLLLPLYMPCCFLARCHATSQHPRVCQRQRRAHPFVRSLHPHRQLVTQKCCNLPNAQVRIRGSVNEEKQMKMQRWIQLAVASAALEVETAACRHISSPAAIRPLLDLVCTRKAGWALAAAALLAFATRQRSTGQPLLAFFLGSLAAHLKELASSASAKCSSSPECGTAAADTCCRPSRSSGSDPPTPRLEGPEHCWRISQQPNTGGDTHGAAASAGAVAGTAGGAPPSPEFKPQWLLAYANLRTKVRR